MNRRLDDPLTLIINIMVSDEDTPMEIWHVNNDCLSHKKTAFVHLQSEVVPVPEGLADVA